MPEAQAPDARPGAGAGPLDAAQRAAARTGRGRRARLAAARAGDRAGARQQRRPLLPLLRQREGHAQPVSALAVCGAQLEAVGAGAAAALAGQGVRFPLVLKPVVACGAPQAHRMALLAAPHGLNGAAAVPLPAVAQAFVAHGGIAHKVYVLGRAVRPQQRAAPAGLPAAAARP